MHPSHHEYQVITRILESSGARDLLDLRIPSIIRPMESIGVVNTPLRGIHLTLNAILVLLLVTISYVMMFVGHCCALIAINMAHATCIHLYGCYARCGYPVGHLYLGDGMHGVLRCALGCVETLSSTFRAISLSLRTVCNGVAGHVLLAVLVDMLLSSIIIMMTISGGGSTGCVDSYSKHLNTSQHVECILLSVFSTLIMGSLDTSTVYS